MTTKAIPLQQTTTEKRGTIWQTHANIYLITVTFQVTNFQRELKIIQEFLQEILLSLETMFFLRENLTKSI